jgi:hypothetical protein
MGAALPAPGAASPGPAPLRLAAARGSFADGPSPGDALTRLLLRFVALVVAYDALASAVVAVTGWRYDVLALGALAIQIAAGRSAGRREGFLGAMAAGACTALAEATLGFGAAWLVGPGRTHLPNAVDYPTAVALATLAGGALGAVGGITALGWEVEERRTAPGELIASARSFLHSLPLDAWLARQLILRGLLIWAGLMLLFVLATGATADSDVGGASQGAATGLRLLVVCAVVAIADLTRRREFVLLADLGVRAGVAVSLYVIPAALLEGLVMAVPR